MARGTASAASTGRKPGRVPARREHTSRAVHRSARIGIGALIAHDIANRRWIRPGFGWISPIFPGSLVTGALVLAILATFTHEGSCHENENCLPGRIARDGCARERSANGPRRRGRRLE